MPTKEVSVTELQKLDPKRFEREYWKWVENHWWEGDETINWYIETNMTARDAVEATETEAAQPARIGWHIDPKDISWSGFYSQGDGLAFDASVHLTEYMELKGYDVTHNALYLDILNYGIVHARVSRGYRQSNHMRDEAECEDYYTGNTEPAGIYQHLETEDWDALVQEQYDDLMDSMLKEIGEEAQDHARSMYRELENDYEASTSEQEFIESCEINEVTFEIEVDDEDTTEDSGQGCVVEHNAV
jgi:hypothetical protein